MNDYADLVRRLSVYGDGLCKEARDAIEAQARQLAECKMCRAINVAADDMPDEIRHLRAQLAVPLPEDVEAMAQWLTRDSTYEQGDAAAMLRSLARRIAEKDAEIESWKRGCRNAEQRMETAMDNAVRAQADAERLKRDLDQAVHVRDVFATGLVAAAAQIVDKDPQ